MVAPRVYILQNGAVSSIVIFEEVLISSIKGNFFLVISSALYLPGAPKSRFYAKNGQF